MKILVYGAGVLGCNLARNLLRAGKDVTLLARGNWAAEIKQNGLRIKDKFSLCTSVSRIPVSYTHLRPTGFRVFSKKDISHLRFHTFRIGQRKRGL